MKTKRIVLIGGPSTGKTSLINKLEDKGQICLHEVSREVTKAAQEEGIEQLFLTEPLLFSEKLLEQRIIQFKQVETINAPYVFIDRGIPDVVAYMDYLGQNYPRKFKDACKDFIYDKVFILPPWKEIHVTDEERYENFDQAEAIQQALIESYTSYGYDPIDVPKASVKDRVEFILNNTDR